MFFGTPPCNFLTVLTNQPAHQDNTNTSKTWALLVGILLFLLKNVKGFDAKVCRHQADLGHVKVSLNTSLFSIRVVLEGCMPLV